MACDTCQGSGSGVNAGENHSMCFLSQSLWMFLGFWQRTVDQASKDRGLIILTFLGAANIGNLLSPLLDSD
jgi:hypothetical protein